MKTAYAVSLTALLALVVAAPAIGQNVLVNPSFEDPPHGAFPTSDPNWPWAPSGWKHQFTDDWQNWQGVFDATWKRDTDFGVDGFHNCNWPNWPDPASPAVDGNYFLGHWFPPQNDQFCEYDNVHTDGRSAYIYQTVTGLTPGTKYYFSCWYATQHPHTWPLVRMVCLPQAYDSGEGTFDPPLNEIYPIYTPIEPDGYLRRAAAPAETESDVWPYAQAHYAGSDERWSKLTGEVTLDANQNAATLFVAFIMSTNNIAEPQYAQVDKVRLATTQELEITNVEFTNFTSTTATIEWDVKDGDNMVYGLSGSDCYVEYGPTTSYGLSVPAIEPDAAVFCDGDRQTRPGHYVATITGLTTGSTYHCRIRVNGGTHSYVQPYVCPGMPTNPDPVTGYRLYDPASSDDQEFAMLPLLTISNINANVTGPNTATITWTTNVAATSKVNYGMFGVIDSSATDGGSTTSHSVNLTGLSPNTPYTYNVQSSAPGYNLTTSTNRTFTTALGPDIMNGDFEFRAKTNQFPKYWTKVPIVGSGSTWASGEWSIDSQSGSWYFGSIANGNGFFKVPACYQQISATPGEVISVYAYSNAYGQAGGTNCDQGVIHRFGENNNAIGLDPTGAVPNFFGTVPATTNWGVPLGSMRFGEYWNGNRCGRHSDWRRLGICAIAGPQGKATIYLRMDSWYANYWVMNMFDNVFLAPLTPVSSVAALKSQPFQTNVDLTQSGGDGFVVTYVAEPPYDTWENEGQPYFYIEDTDRASGIKVTFGPGLSKPAWLTVGKKVNIKGTLDWGAFYNYTHKKNYYQQLRMDNPCGEVVLRAIEITDAGDGDVPEPVGVTNKTLGGASSSDPWFSIPGVAGGSGANNVGLRVRTWGKIVEIGEDPEGEYYYVIDDGSALPLEDLDRPKPSIWPQSAPGLYVRTRDIYLPMLSDNSREIQVGDYAILTGISSVRLDIDWTDDTTDGAWSDPNDPSITPFPQAMKNKRAIKVEPGGARFFTLP